MFKHCKPNTYNTHRLLAAVLAILLATAYASAEDYRSKTEKPRIALLGDSMTWIGGDSCQNETGWSHCLKESGVASAIDVYARSGATWTNTTSTRRNPDHYTELLHDDNVVYNQAIRLMERADTTDATPDLIILFAGANDAWFSSRRPGLFDNSTIRQPDNPTIQQPNHSTTLSASIRLVSDLLEQRFPEATLLFVAPLQMSKTDAATIHHVADIIEETAGQRGWTTLRPDRDTAITHAQEAKSPRYTSDGVHTNPAGGRLLGSYILSHLPQPFTLDP